MSDGSNGGQGDPELGRAELRLANDVAAMASIAGWVERFGAEHRLPPNVVGDLKLVLDEAVGNVIVYGYAAGARGEIVLRLRCRSHQVELEIEDDGSPFDPLNLVPPDLMPPLAQRPTGGPGVEVLMNLMDPISYERVDGRNIFKLLRDMTAAC